MEAMAGELVLTWSWMAMTTWISIRRRRLLLPQCLLLLQRRHLSRLLLP